MDSRRKGGLNGEGRGERCQRGNLSICSPIDGHLHCFQGLVIRNRATINILIQFFFFFLVDTSFHFFWNSWITRQVNTDKKMPVLSSVLRKTVCLLDYQLITKDVKGYK